jgi:hypothetical protein
MRLLIIVAALGFIGWYAFKRFKNPDPGASLIGGAIQTVAGSSLAKANPEPAAPIPSVVPGQLGQVIESGDTFRPTVAARMNGDRDFLLVSKTYRFRHRDAPTQAEIGVQVQGSSGTVQVLVDAPTRSVLVVGPLETVDIVYRYLESIDRMPGSCSVQTWAVYVDRTVEKGFDLVAALRAVTGSGITGEIGNGGVTLDVTAGEITTALTAIADGSVVEVIQRPHVRLLHGQPSKIESIQEVPVPSTAVSQGIAQTSIQYRKVGLQLNVLPTFFDSGSVRLAVEQTNGLIGQNVKIEGNDIPIIQSQTVGTTATLTVGQTIVLGGVSTYRERTVRGLLRNVKEVSEGSLYVILSTFHDEPRARPVEAPAMFDALEGLEPLPDAEAWIDGQLLPPLGWEKQEADFLKAHAK